MRRAVLPAVSVAFLLASCGTIPSEFTRQVDQDLMLAVVKRAPDQYRGKVLMLGGTVSERTDLPDATKMRIQQRELDSRSRPYMGGLSEGEFLVEVRPPVNPVQYPAGKFVTMVGRLRGAEPAAGRSPLPSFDALYLRSWDSPALSSDEVYGQPSCQRIIGTGC